MKVLSYLCPLSFVLILLMHFQINAQSNNTFQCGFKPTASQIQHYESQLPVSTSLSNLSVT